jgi:Na+/H+-dicarboxylate symporter/ABC-type amino acid transport substrate-binding protein
MSLSTKVLVGLLSGVVVGLFFGELVAFLSVVGDAFVLLLQMAVLPYVVCSLISGIGGLQIDDAKRLAKTTGVVLLVTWLLTLGVVASFPLALPAWESASFFTSTLVTQAPPFDFLGLYIPANPFRALADSTVPAVVLFSIALGLALMGLDDKEPIIRGLTTARRALEKITGFVVRLSPIGVFAIAASAAGTMELEQLENLLVYGFIYIAFSMVLTFWLLPSLVTLFTGLRYRQVVGIAWGAIVTAFATGSLFVVMPILAHQATALLVQNDMDQDGSADMVHVVVPVVFNLPSAGKLLTLGFLVFAAWMSGSAMSLTELPKLLSTGFLAFFGSTMTAVPFLLDLFRLPSDSMQFFVLADNIVGNRFGVALAAMHLFSIAVISGCALGGRARVPRFKLVQFVATAVIVMALVVVGLRVIFALAPHEYRQYGQLVQSEPLLRTTKMSVYDSVPAEWDDDRSLSVVDRIEKRGTLRVGYRRDDLPYVFSNADGELVGFDVEMAHQLARELDVSLEMVLALEEDMPELLRNGQLDIVMSGVLLSPSRQRVVDFTVPYLVQTIGFVVPDYRREAFATNEAVREQDSLRIAVLDITYYEELIREQLPNAEVVVTATPRAFFQGKLSDVDALVISAEAGSAWTLVYPEFSVVVPKPDILTAPAAYAVGKSDDEWLQFVNTWIELKRHDQTIGRLFDYWFEGERDEIKQPRWSVIRNVLSWVD